MRTRLLLLVPLFLMVCGCATWEPGAPVDCMMWWEGTERGEYAPNIMALDSITCAGHGRISEENTLVWAYTEQWLRFYHEGETLPFAPYSALTRMPYPFPIVFPGG